MIFFKLKDFSRFQGPVGTRYQIPDAKYISDITSNPCGVALTLRDQWVFLSVNEQKFNY